MAFYSKENIKNDLLGGFSAGIVTLPVALAYGVATGLGPIAGMFTAICLGLIASIFGGTDTQISSPTGAMTVVVAFIIATEIKIADGLESAFPAVIAIFALTGIIQMIMGLFKVGANIKYVPYTVVSGFMSGIGIIIIVLQIHDICGIYDSGYKSVPQVLLHLDYFISNAHWPSIAVATVTLGIIYFIPRLTKKIPGSLVALIVVTLGVFLTDLPVHKLGSVSIEFPHFNFHSYDQLMQPAALGRIALAGFSLAILGSINTLLTSVVADKMTHSLHNSNKELFGQGLGNFVSALLGGFPGSGATACTVANIQSGGRNKISGVIGSLFLLIVLLFGTDIAANIPNALLGAILVHIGFVLIDFRILKKVPKINKVDNLVMFTVLILTVFWNLVFAVSIGLVIAAFHFMKRMSDVVEEDTNRSKVDEVVNETINRFNIKLMKAMVQLFAILADSKGGGENSRAAVKDFIRAGVSQEDVAMYLDHYDDVLDNLQRSNDREVSRRKKTSMSSVKVLRICTQLGNELGHKEKFFVVNKLIDYIHIGEQALEQEWEFVDLVAEVFGLSGDELKLAKFMASRNESDFRDSQTFIRDVKSFESEVLFKNIKGPVFFGFSHRFLLSMRNLPSNIKVVVFNMSFVPFMDHSGARTFLEVVRFLKDRNIQVCFCDVDDDNLSLLRGVDLIPELVGDEFIFNSIEECVLWLNQPGAIQNWNEGNLFIPLAFAPGAEGVIGLWNIRNTHQYPLLEITVSNESGELVFHSKGYENAWDGMFGGNMLPQGRYDYKITYNQENLQEKHGSVYLIR